MLTIIVCTSLSILLVTFLGFVLAKLLPKPVKISKKILLKIIIAGFLFGIFTSFIFGFSTYTRHQYFLERNYTVMLRIKGERLYGDVLCSTIKVICEKGINVSIPPSQIQIDSIRTNELSEELADAYNLSYAIMEYEKCEDKLTDLDGTRAELVREIKRIENSPWTIWVPKEQSK